MVITELGRTALILGAWQLFVASSCNLPFKPRLDDNVAERSSRIVGNTRCLTRSLHLPALKGFSSIFKPRVEFPDLILSGLFKGCAKARVSSKWTPTCHLARPHLYKNPTAVLLRMLNSR